MEVHDHRSTPARGPRVLPVLLLTLALVLALLLPAQALAAFFDVGANHPYAAAIQEMADRGIVNGYGNGNFGPNDQVLRQHFAKMIALTLDLPAAEYECYFTDVDKNLSPTDPLFPDHYIAVCAAWGITTGATDTTFAPYDDMSRAQLITMVARAAELPEPPPNYEPSFGNFDGTHYPWARRAARAGLLDGLLGMGAGYDFWKPATRGEVCQMLSNLLAWQASDLEAIRQAIEDSGQAADDFYVMDSRILGDAAGVIIGGPTSDTASVYLERRGGTWEVVGIGTDLSYEAWMDLGAPENIADFLAAYSEVDIIRDVIAQSDAVDVNFEILDSLVIGRWAGVIIGSPGLDNLPILLYRSGLVGWAILDLGTGLSQADWLAWEVAGEFCPRAIAQFLTPC